MPTEVAILALYPYPVMICPQCQKPFLSFLRGQIQRSKRFMGFLWRRPYCAVICAECKRIVGWEQP
jgi:hypothetical protein